jgi:hypothetical protein
MTLPDERYRAVLAAERLLKDILNPRVTPRVPRDIRNRAAAALRHYPDLRDMQAAAQTSPHIFAEWLDPLYVMIKQHEMSESVREELDPVHQQLHGDPP